MANEYFQPGSVPAPNAPGSSAVMRQEFASISAGFDKLPILAGHANELVTVNATGTALVTGGAVLGDYVTKDGVFTLTNKTIAWADNIWPGFGTGATKNAGKMAGQVLLLENNMQLPAIDGSLLTGLNAGMVSGVVQILQGGTGASTVAGAQTALGIDLKAPIHNPVFTGAPSAPTPPTGDTSSRLATTWFVTNTINAIGAVTAGSDLPLMDGVASAGNLSLFAASRQDHVHPSDTSRAPASAATAAGTSFAPAGSIAATNVQAALQELDTEKAPLTSPTFTGVAQAPTVADPSDTTDKIATTAWVQTRLVQIPVGVQLSNSNAQNLGTTPAPGVGVEASRWDHVHAFPIASQIPSVATGDVSATNVQAAIAELANEKSPVGHTHVAADVTNLSATLVPFTPTGTIAANNVQAAVAEVAAEAVQKTSATGAAIIPTGNTAGRPAAVEGYFRRNSEIGQWEGYTGSSWVAVGQGNAASTPFTPAGNIAATNVQAAIQELDTEKVSYGYLSATNTPFTPSGNIAANNVQAAIVELDSETQAALATKVSLNTGTPFMRNKLFNGEVTRINQRGFDGNWATKNIWNAGNTIAQQELCYGYDMWAKASATTMCQLIEAGNFRPNTVHTLSGIGVTTQQITSPPSGNWTIEVPQGATFVQVEEGTVATPFEIRPISFELAQCQRYLWRGLGMKTYTFNAWTAGAFMGFNVAFPVQMRVVPALTINATGATVTNATSGVTDYPTVSGFRYAVTAAAAGGVDIAFTVGNYFNASAVI